MSRWVISVEMDCIDPDTGTEYQGDDPVEAARIGWRSLSELEKPMVMVARYGVSTRIVDGGRLDGSTITSHRQWAIDLEQEDRES